MGMSRRAAGEGSVRQRGPTRWEGRYIAADGRSRSLYGKTKREVTDRLRVAINEAQTGIPPVDQRLTTARYLASWLEQVKAKNRPRTHASYADVVARYIVPTIGRVALAKLQPEHVTAMLLGVRQAHPHLSQTTQRYVYTVLRIALGRALKLGKVHRNVATLIDPPARVRREIVPMSADEARLFLSSMAGMRREVLYRLAIATGLRQGELLGLRWQDLDMDATTLTVRHTLSMTGELGEPKTGSGRRTVWLEEDTLAMLRAHRTRQQRERLAAGDRWRSVDREQDYVFATSVGTPIQARNLIRDYHRDLVVAGVPRRPFHSMRHAYATMLLEDGVDIATVSKLLGHSSLATTADFYGHLTPKASRDAADRIKKILAG